MAFDISMIKANYERLASSVEAARKATGKPLTASEKILYAHLWDGEAKQAFARGADYVDFAPDRIACQDATAQMALLQFMQAGKSKVAVPTTVHCDHLIQAKDGAAATNPYSSAGFDFVSVNKYGRLWKPGHLLSIRKLCISCGMMVEQILTQSMRGVGMVHWCWKSC